MTQNLKIEVLTGDISIDGMVVTNLVTKEELSAAIVKKADLGTDGKIPTSQLPAEIVNTAGIVDEVKLQLETSIKDAVDESNAYAESYTDNALSSKADLTSGKVPLEQLPTIDQYPQFGTTLSNLSTSILTSVKQRTDQLEKSKADLGEDGKVLREQIPSYEKISGLPEQLEVMSTQTAAVSGELDEHKLQTADQIDTLKENIEANVQQLTDRQSHLMRTYATKELGVDAKVGVKPGEYFYVRSSDEDEMLVEYQNVGNVPTPSGKSYSSTAYVQSVAKYTALPFVEGKPYALNERVALENGDIVKSTVAGNTANPNVDMTSWTDTSAAQNIKNSLGGSVQGFIDQQLQTNAFLSNISVTPEMYGAKGDGVANDTAAVRSWWESPFVYKQARGKYKVNLGNSGATYTADKSLYVDMVGAEFLPTTKAAYILQVNCTTDGGTIEIKGGKLTCNNLIARPLRIHGTGRCKVVSVYFNSATDVKETGQAFTAVALSMDLKSDCFDIHHNNYKGVSRITDNPGFVSCIGIFLSNVDATCLIYGNEISLIRAVNNADADGISIFSSNRLVSPSQVQRLNVRIFNNRVIDCQGRFVKLQCPGQVYGNDFRSETLTLIPAFRVVDAQFGGVDAYANEWRLASGLRYQNGDTTFYFYQGKGDAGSEENVGYCRDNKLYLDENIRYLAFVQVIGGKHSVTIKDNVVKDEDGLTKVSQLVRLNILDTAPVSSISLSVEANEYTARTADLLILTGAGFRNANLNDKLTLTLINNKPKQITYGAKLIRTTPEANNPYLGDVLVQNNGTQDMNYNMLLARGLDVTKLRMGNSFYYENDGSGAGASGLLNVPAGYTRSISVDVSSTIELTKSPGSKKAVKSASAWYEYTGILLT